MLSTSHILDKYLMLNESFTNKVIEKAKDQKHSVEDLNFVDYDTFCIECEKTADKMFDISVSDYGLGEKIIRFKVISLDFYIMATISIIKENVYEQGCPDFFTFYLSYGTNDDIIIDSNENIMIDDKEFIVRGADIIEGSYSIKHALYQDFGGVPYQTSSKNLQLIKKLIKDLRIIKDHLLIETRVLSMQNIKGRSYNDALFKIYNDKIKDYFLKDDEDWSYYLETGKLHESVNLFPEWEIFKNLPKFKDMTISYVMNEFAKHISNDNISLNTDHFFLHENVVEYQVKCDHLDGLSLYKIDKCYDPFTNISTRYDNLEEGYRWQTCKDSYQLDYSPHKEIFEEIVIKDLERLVEEYQINKTKQNITI